MEQTAETDLIKLLYHSIGELHKLKDMVCEMHKVILKKEAMMSGWPMIPNSKETMKILGMKKETFQKVLKKNDGKVKLRIVKDDRNRVVMKLEKYSLI